MSRWQIDNDAGLDNAEVYRRLSSVDLAASNDDYLYIDCKLWQGIMEGDRTLRTIVTPMQLAQFFDWDLLDPLELIYVGKSTDGALQRTRNHNKWGKITSDLTAEEVALVYFLELETSSLTREETYFFTVAERYADEHIDRSAQALIIEAAFIKYFFDEKRYNLQVHTMDSE